MKLLLICFVALTCVSAFSTGTLEHMPNGRRLKLAASSTSSSASSVSMTSTNSNSQASTEVRSTIQTVDGPGANQATNCLELERPDGTKVIYCSRRPIPDGSRKCTIRSTPSASGDGLLYLSHETKNRKACCEACRGVPTSRCNSWWRAKGPNQTCYINSSP